jgi:histidinol-phosphate aminotransferase
MSAPRPRPAILRIAPYRQGKSSLEGIAQPIKLSSNESPLGPSPTAIEAYRALSDTLFRYPEGNQRELRNAIAKVFSLDADKIVCGNGSDELIQLVIRAYVEPGDEVIASEFSFAMCTTHALAQGAKVVIAPEQPAMRIDVDAILARLTARTRLVAIATPNNPCGTYLPFAELERLHAALPDDVLLLVDGAYGDYVTATDYSSGFDLVERNDNVVVTRTFSKLYGLAGLRIGWIYAPPGVVDALQRIRTPFNANAAALAAATEAVLDTAHAAKVREHNARWLDIFTSELSDMGLAVVPSVANFVLVRFPATPYDAAAADAYLKAHGIIARPVAAGGPENHLRITIGLGHENRTLLSTLREFIRGV